MREIACRSRGHGFDPLVQEDATYPEAAKPEQQNYWRLARLEPVLGNRRSPSAAREGPAQASTGENSNEDPVQTKNKQIK